MIPCSHDGFHSGVGRYQPDSGQLRYVLVCDRCEAELREVHTQEYHPAFDPGGNDEYLGRAA